jgi:hypothetical protein
MGAKHPGRTSKKTGPPEGGPVLTFQIDVPHQAVRPHQMQLDGLRGSRSGRHGLGRATRSYRSARLRTAGLGAASLRTAGPNTMAALRAARLRLTGRDRRTAGRRSAGLRAAGLRLASLRTAGPDAMAALRAARLRLTSRDRRTAGRRSAGLRAAGLRLASLRTAGPGLVAALRVASGRCARVASRCTNRGGAAVARDRAGLIAKPGNAQHRNTQCDAEKIDAIHSSNLQLKKRYRSVKKTSRMPSISTRLFSGDGQPAERSFLGAP